MHTCFHVPPVYHKAHQHNPFYINLFPDGVPIHLLLHIIRKWQLLWKTIKWSKKTGIKGLLGAIFSCSPRTDVSPPPNKTPRQLINSLSSLAVNTFCPTERLLVSRKNSGEEGYRIDPCFSHSPELNVLLFYTAISPWSPGPGQSRRDQDKKVPRFSVLLFSSHTLCLT